jgi:uncharacterized membrane protein
MTKNKLVGGIMLVISGCLLFISEFSLMIGSYTTFELFQLSDLKENFYIYLIPIICGIGICISGIGFQSEKKPIRNVLYIFSIISLNLIFYFLTEVFNAHGSFIWNYTAIYLIITSLMLMLFGFLFLFATGK